VSFDTSWPDAYLATVGVFDGMHIGHRTIVESMLAASRETGLPAILFTFDPRPVAVFAPGTPPDELTPLPRKLRLLAEVGVERVTVLRFSHAFARIEPEDFLKDVLGAGNGLKGIWVGHDFRFGHRRRGDWRMIQEEAPRYGYRALRVEAVERDGLPVSSSRIRAALRSGEVDVTARMLGRYPDVEGEVVTGRGQGRKLLVPTANLRLPAAQFIPATGVYAGEAEWEGGWLPAVMNLGHRPTVGPSEDLTPEVHILDFEGDLVGRRLLFRMRRRLREERKFASISELREQIVRDISTTTDLAHRWKADETPLPNERDPDSLAH
jgi:riboflavin kinase/FMN adenylyltransferase